MEWFYTICLFVAIFANLKEVRMVFMCFLAGWFLILIPHALPDSNSYGVEWFWLLNAIELFFMIIVFSARSPASTSIIFLSAINIMNHSTAAWVFLQLGDTPGFHQSILRASEICQILSLLIYSRPSIAWFDNALAKYKRRENRNEQRFRMVAAVR